MTRQRLVAIGIVSEKGVQNRWAPAGSMESTTDMPERLTENLIRDGHLDATQAHEAMARQVLLGGAIDTALLELRLVAEPAVVDALAKTYGLQSVGEEESTKKPDQKALRAFPEPWAKKHGLAPLEFDEENKKLFVLSPAPADAMLIKRLAELLELDIQPQLAPEFRVHQRISLLYGVEPPERFSALIQGAQPVPKSNHTPTSDPSTQDNEEKPDASTQAPLTAAKETNSPASPVQDAPYIPQPQTTTTAQETNQARAIENEPPSKSSFPVADARELQQMDVWQTESNLSSQPLNFQTAIQRLQQAQTRDEIIQIALEYAAKDLEFCTILTVHQTHLVAWRSIGSENATLEGKKIPLSPESAFQVVLNSNAHYLGPLPTSDSHQTFLDAAKRPAPRAVLIVPVRIRNRTVALICAENGPHTIPPRMAADLMLFTPHVQHALEELLIRKKRASLSQLSQRPPETSTPPTSLAQPQGSASLPRPLVDQPASVPAPGDSDRETRRPIPYSSSLHELFPEIPQMTAGEFLRSMEQKPQAEEQTAAPLAKIKLAAKPARAQEATQDDDVVLLPPLHDDVEEVHPNDQRSNQNLASDEAIDSERAPEAKAAAPDAPKSDHMGGTPQETSLRPADEIKTETDDAGKNVSEQPTGKQTTSEQSNAKEGSDSSDAVTAEATHRGGQESTSAKSPTLVDDAAEGTAAQGPAAKNAEQTSVVAPKTAAAAAAPDAAVHRESVSATASPESAAAAQDPAKKDAAQTNTVAQDTQADKAATDTALSAPQDSVDPADTPEVRQVGQADTIAQDTAKADGQTTDAPPLTEAQNNKDPAGTTKTREATQGATEKDADEPNAIAKDVEASKAGIRKTTKEDGAQEGAQTTAPAHSNPTAAPSAVAQNASPVPASEASPIAKDKPSTTTDTTAKQANLQGQPVAEKFDRTIDSSGNLVDAAHKKAAAQREVSARELNELFDRLEDNDSVIRRRAKSTLLGMGPTILPAVVDRFPGHLYADPFSGRLPSFGNCGEIMSILEGFGQDSVPYAFKKLEASDRLHRFFGTYFFSAVIVPSAVPRLIQRLHDEEKRICMVAARALFNYREQKEFTMVLDHLHGRLELGTSLAARRHAAFLLGLFRDVTAIPSLIEIFQRKEKTLFEGAENALAEITKQQFGPNAKKWRTWWAKSQSLSRISWLIDGLAAKKPTLRQSAVEELRAVTGEDMGFNAGGPRRQRERARQKWVRWWREQQNKNREFESAPPQW